LPVLGWDPVIDHDGGLNPVDVVINQVASSVVNFIIYEHIFDTLWVFSDCSHASQVPAVSKLPLLDVRRLNALFEKLNVVEDVAKPLPSELFSFLSGFRFIVFVRNRVGFRWKVWVRPLHPCLNNLFMFEQRLLIGNVPLISFVILFLLLKVVRRSQIKLPVFSGWG
jgi:hypothetical protein